MNILGMIFDPDFGHPAACLMRDGKLEAFVEEERLARVKQAKGYFPSRATAFCLQQGGLELGDIDYIAFGWDAEYYRARFPLFMAGAAVQQVWKRCRTRDVSRLPVPDRRHLGSGLLSGIRDLIAHNSRFLRQQIAFGLNEAGFAGEPIPPVRFVKHHLAHAASAYYASGFPHAAILIFDGHGEQNTVSIYKGEDRRLTLLHEINIPNSLGWFYSAFTEYLGWDPNEGEVKLMGLAPFGKADPAVTALMDRIVKVSETGIEVDADYLFLGRRSYGQFYGDRVVAHLGPPRGKNDPFSQHHKNIACAVQQKLEQAGLALSALAMRLAGSRNLCLAGGIALNCKMNGVIHRRASADRMFVQPISHDAGVAFGAAMVVAMAHDDDCRDTMRHVYLGPSFENEAIEKVLIRNKIAFEYRDDIAETGAIAIADGCIVGWFQGAMEAGPRALGGRSILADPRDPAMKDKVNDYVKFRENWRPFALSILEEYADEYLVKPAASPFMIMAFDVVKDKYQAIQSAMHWIDHTTRPQTVSRDTHPRYWELIEAFRKRTSVPGVLNTSFNVKGEPIVCTPEDALRCFYGTGMDVLIMGNYVIKKTPSSAPDSQE